MAVKASSRLPGATEHCRSTDHDLALAREARRIVCCPDGELVTACGDACAEDISRSAIIVPR